MRFVLPLFLLLAAGSAGARTKAAILNFTGKGGSAARTQLAATLCDSVECVAPKKVTAGSKPDWKKAKRERVTYILGGKVAKVKRKEALELSLFRGGKSIWKKSLPLMHGQLTDRALASLADDILAAMGVEPGNEPPATKEPAESASVVPEKETPVISGDASSGSNSREDRVASAGPSSSGESSESSGEVSRPAPEVSREGKNELFALEVGPDLFSRHFAYTAVETSNLRSYDAGLVIAPHVFAELYPLATVSTGLAAGIGIEGGYLFAVGLKSRRRADGDPHPTTLTRLDAAVKLKIHPVSGSEAAVIPLMGYRNATFNVGPAADGSVLDGLPGINYSALVLGVGGEVPFGDRVLAFARAAFLPVLSSGEIISPTYFPNGSASGLEFALGAGVKIAGGFQVRVTGQFTRYALSFKSAAGDPYVAAGAVDQYLGANVGIRYAY